MKTKTIFKTLAAAMLMPTMLLTIACSNNDDEIVNTENPANTKGYALPVTINVTRQGDATRASYNESTRKLEFSTGDKLFVEGMHTEAGEFAGELTWQSGGIFSGTIYTQNEWTGTADELFSASGIIVNATLLPNGYESYKFLTIFNKGSVDLYDDVVAWSMQKAFVASETAKKTGVEQLSWEKASTYSSGFALAPANAVVSFTISGLTANKEVAVSFDTNIPGVISGNVTTSAEGVATFALGLPPSYLLENGTLTVDGNNIALPTKTTEAGHIYNISRPVHGVFWNSTDISSIDISSGGSVEIGGITFACDDMAGFTGSTLYSQSGNISFTSSKGNIKKIEINHSGYSCWYGAEDFDGWPSDYDAEGGTFTWEGSPTETVELPETDSWGQIEGITSIVFTLE